MSVRKSTTWLAAGLYYNEPWEEFLLKAVKPYVDIVMQTGITERYFFLRSWEKGPHIQLFLKGNTTILEDFVRPNLQEHFRHYFHSRPSFRVEPKYPTNFPESYKWNANNTLHFIEETPETNCFSGRLGLSICEKHFHATSDLILNAIQNKGRRWTYDDALSTATRLHLGLTYAMGMKLGEAQSFFKTLLENWHYSHQAKNQKNPFSKEKKQKDLFQSFFTAFDLQKENIVAFNQALWIAMTNQLNSGDDSFKNWLQLNTNIHYELKLVQDAGKFTATNQCLNGLTTKTLSLQQKQLWSVFARLIQLTNNRLGITGKDEGYLFYTLANSLSTPKAPIEMSLSMMSVAS